MNQLLYALIRFLHVSLPRTRARAVAAYRDYGCWMQPRHIVNQPLPEKHTLRMRWYRWLLIQAYMAHVGKLPPLKGDRTVLAWVHSLRSVSRRYNHEA